MREKFFDALTAAIYSEERWIQDTTYLEWKREEEGIRKRYIDRLIHSYTHQPWRQLRWGLPPIEDEPNWTD